MGGLRSAVAARVYGTNYQTPPVGTIPGAQSSAATIPVAAGNSGAGFICDSSIKPGNGQILERPGAIWDSQGIAADHNFRLIVDYFNIETEDQIGQIADPTDR